MEEVEERLGITSHGLAAHLAAYARGGVQRIPTRLADLDEALKGGLGRGELTVLCGRSASGKSLLAQNLLESNLDQPSVFWSMEMSAAMTIQRSLSMWSGKPFHSVFQAVQAGVVPEERLAAWSDAHRLHWWVTEGWTSTDTMASVLDRAADQLGVEPTLCVLDYLELVGAGSGGEDAAAAQVVEAARELKRWAKKHDVAVVALHQTNRSVRRGEPISEHSLRYGGFTEADVVAGIWRPHQWEPPPKTRTLPLNHNQRQYLETKIAVNLIKNRPAVTLQETGWLFDLDPSGRVTSPEGPAPWAPEMGTA